MNIYTVPHCLTYYTLTYSTDGYGGRILLTTFTISVSLTPPATVTFAADDTPTATVVIAFVAVVVLGIAIVTATAMINQGCREHASRNLQC